MHVKVVGDSGACRPTKIHPDVESIRFVDLAQRCLAMLRKVRHLVRGRFGGCVEFTQVSIRRNHQVSADVRIAIKNDEIMLAAMQDEILRIVGGTLLGYTEDAVLFVGHFGPGRGDIFVPPRAPESIHSSKATLLDRVVPFCRVRGS